MTYPKIPAVLTNAAATGAWTATEKLHGAQLTVAYDGTRLSVGKRKAWLTDDTPFFGWQLLRDRLHTCAAAAFTFVGAPVRLYGELYGGHYPHPSVAPVPGASPVQTGVWYSPDIRFALFDVADARSLEPLLHDEITALAASTGVDVVPLLARGPRPLVEAIEVRFDTRLPAMLHLPPLPGNVAEGLVLRPDARLPLPTRPILKRKIPEFDESAAGYGDARPWTPHLRPTDIAPLAATLVNPARIASARSKVGPDDATALFEEVVLDVMLDLAAAYPMLESHPDLEPAVRSVALRALDG